MMPDTYRMVREYDRMKTQGMSDYAIGWRFAEEGWPRKVLVTLLRELGFISYRSHSIRVGFGDYQRQNEGG